MLSLSGMFIFGCQMTGFLVDLGISYIYIFLFEPILPPTLMSGMSEIETPAFVDSNEMPTANMEVVAGRTNRTCTVMRAGFFLNFYLFFLFFW